MNRLKAGFVLVRNPMNGRQVSQVSLAADLVDCIVFWTKNPGPMLRHVDALQRCGIPFYFQFTITPYGEMLEPFVPPVGEAVAMLKTLSAQIGKANVIWRYDPVILSAETDFAYHVARFGEIAEALSPVVGRCVISFLDRYRKIGGNMARISVIDPAEECKLELARQFGRIADKLGITVEACAEATDFSSVGIRRGRCIDPVLISALCRGGVNAGKDRFQRQECGCVESVDIGAYNSCAHGCLYCYANTHRGIAKEHNVASPLLCGEVTPEDRITERKMRRVTNGQGELPLFHAADLKSR